MSIKAISLTALLLVSYQTAFARIIHYGEAKETVTVSYGGPTIFRFDEDVKTISQASRYKIEPSDSANPSYKMLSVIPRFTNGSNDVTFILANGAVVQTRIVVVPKALPEKTDSFYDFRPKDQLIDRETFSAQEDNVTTLELMKAMIRSDKMVGYQVRSLERSVRSGMSNVEAKLVKVYTGPKYNGYIFEVENKSSKKSYAIDLLALTLGKPNLAILSQTDEKVLEPKGKNKKYKTYLRIVAKPTSVYYSVRLPIGPIGTNTKN